MKKTSNIKRLGIKSIHFNKDDIIIEDSFKKNEIIFKTTYDDIDELNKATDQLIKDRVVFEDLDNESGFKIYDNNELSSTIKSVKNKSFINSVLYDNDYENNFYVQIYNNLNDLRRIISSYLNDVIYSLNITLNKDDSFQSFDRIGMLVSNVELKNYGNDKNPRSRLIQDTLIPFYFSLKEFNPSKDFYDANSFDFDSRDFKNVFFKRENALLQDICSCKLSKEQMKLIGIKDNVISEFEDGRSVPIHLIVKKINWKNFKNEAIIKFIYSIVRVYDELRLLSSLRQYVVHNQLIKIDYFKDKAQQDINSFIKSFVKVNNKLILILNEYSKDNNKNIKIQDFLNYLLYDESKNLGISIKKVSELVYEEMNFDDISKDLLTEFKTKFLTVLRFLLVLEYKKNNKEYIELKQASDEDEKKKVYIKIKNELMKGININSLINTILKYLGKVEIKADYIKADSIRLNNDFYPLLYSFSSYLPNKEANSMFSDIITKLESINDLMVLISKYNEKTINKIDFINDNPELNNNIWYDFINLEYDKDDLYILKSLRNKAKADKKDIKASDFDEVINSFRFGKDKTIESYKNELLKDESGKIIEGKKKKKATVYPLKQLLRNNVFVSKYYQYIKKYTKPRVCKMFTTNKSIVRYVINKMLRNDLENNTNSQHLYLLNIYNSFRGLKENELKDSYVEDLINNLATFTLDDVVDSIFNKIAIDFKALISLYFNVSYQIVKGLIEVNSAYFLAFKEYSEVYVKYNNLKNDKGINYDLKLVEGYLNNANNSKSYIQIKNVYNQDYINNLKDITTNDLYKLYRNIVEHISLVSSDGLDELLNNIPDYKDKEISSFALYQLLLINRLKTRYNNPSFFSKIEELTKDSEIYSQKFVIFINLMFAYNPSRFNRITIEKYFNRRWK